MIELDVDGRVAWVRLARPEVLNALSRAMTAALEAAVDRLASMPDVRVLVLAARGRAFSAGNDLREMAALTPEDAEALAARQARLMDRFATLPQVTLAAVDGYALGGGLMLAVAQDLRIASDRAKFGLPEVTLGFNPAYGIRRLLEVVPGGNALDLLLTGRTVRATDALRMGLANRVVAPATLEASAGQWAAEIAEIPREGVVATKRLVREIRAGQPAREPESYAAALRTPDARERLRAFAERKAARPD